MVRSTSYVAAAALVVSAGCGVGAFAPSSSSSVGIAANRPIAATMRTPSAQPLHARRERTALNLSSEAEDLVKKSAAEAEDAGAADAAEAQMQAMQKAVAVAEEENWEADSKVVELAGLGIWMASLSGFIFANNWIGPWPAFMTHIPERIFFTGHMLGGMLFGGGIIMTTALEWLCVKNRQPAVLTFYFDKVPLLDMALVLPGLTLAMFSGTGLTITRYGGLGIAPAHIPVVFYILTAFAAWWGATDLATQGKAMRAIDEWVASNGKGDIPQIVQDRFWSNIVSCGFVITLYAAMVLKPGTLPQYTPHLAPFF